MTTPADRSEAVRHHSKRMGREIAMQYLYSCDTRGELPGAATFETFFEALVVEYGHGDERLMHRAREFAVKLYELVALHQDEIDAILRPRCESWGWERIGAVDRAVMRAALAEMLYGEDTPVLVCIDEAVEITRDFAGAESGNFVNGVLNAIKNDLAKIKR